MPQLSEKTWGESWKRPIAVPDMMQVWDSATRLTLGLLLATMLIGLLSGLIISVLAAIRIVAVRFSQATRESANHTNQSPVSLL